LEPNIFAKPRFLRVLFQQSPRIAGVLVRTVSPLLDRRAAIAGRADRTNIRADVIDEVSTVPLGA
jgi:hypothetical protein